MSSFNAAPRTASFRFFKYLPSAEMVETVAMLAVALVISVSVNTML
ncbi:hypothetical protein FBZ89_10596 [Nitrospirillum amazonense]|uniref:Uncharacterized protein n=1 Tax=Nitrospirillum amazonense TaxID=28077 RepID=A0A560FI19_9PROT|nr:hypothetical protein [Nitrospirillum amazonense]TWB21226.1 hypothetical protein FBZ89_10596 [Nitrospirillum amazonense]